MCATPESVSVAAMWTETGPLTQPAGASSEVPGALSSISMTAVWVASMLPTPSVPRYAMVCVPSPETSTEPAYSVSSPPSRV